MLAIRPTKRQIIYKAITLTGPAAALGGGLAGVFNFFLGYFWFPIEDPVFLRQMFLLNVGGLAVGGYLGGIIGSLLSIRFFQDAAELVFTDKVIIGRYGQTILFTSKVTLPLEQIDRKRIVGSNFWERTFKGGYIWSLDGRKIFFIRRLFTAEQLKIIDEKLGITL